jgi:hypothetical protein
MDRQRNSGPLLNAIPLLNAVLCADCEMLSDSASDTCEVCGSRSLLNLERLLGGSVGQVRARVVPAEQFDRRREFTVLVNRDRDGRPRPPRRIQPERRKA